MGRLGCRRAHAMRPYEDDLRDGFAGIFLLLVQSVSSCDSVILTNRKNAKNRFLLRFFEDGGLGWI